MPCFISNTLRRTLSWGFEKSESTLKHIQHKTSCFGPILGSFMQVGVFRLNPNSLFFNFYAVGQNLVTRPAGVNGAKVHCCLYSQRLYEANNNVGSDFSMRFILLSLPAVTKSYNSCSVGGDFPAYATRWLTV